MVDGLENEDKENRVALPYFRLSFEFGSHDAMLFDSTVVVLVCHYCLYCRQRLVAPRCIGTMLGGHIYHLEVEGWTLGHRWTKVDGEGGATSVRDGKERN